jgi:hypothetical protein
MIERPRHARLKYGMRELTAQDTQIRVEEGVGRVRGGGRRQVKETVSLSPKFSYTVKLYCMSAPPPVLLPFPTPPPPPLM